MVKNILIYNSNEPLPEQGGMERVTDLLARTLSEKGYEVILLFKRGNRLKRDYEAPVKIYQLPEHSVQSFFACLLRKERIDAVIDQTEGGILGPFGIFKSINEAKLLIDAPVKFIAVQHNSPVSYINNLPYILIDVNANGISQRVVNIFKRIFYLSLKRVHATRFTKRKYADLNKNYDKIVTLSPSFINDFIRFCPNANKDKLVAIPDLNTFEQATPSSLERRVLFVGRLMINPKGVDRLLRIWKMVEEENHAWSLDIVGDGEDRVKLETMAYELGVKRVKFHGYQDPKSFYERASIFCMTSTYEGFGMVLTEAMQHGCVPIAFDSYSSVRDIIDDSLNGMLVKPFDEADYSQKLSFLINNKDEVKRMSENAKRKSEFFSKTIITDQWIKLFKELVK